MGLQMFHWGGFALVMGLIFGSVIVAVLNSAGVRLTSVAKYARKPLRRCVRAVLRALAHVVGATAVAVFYPPVAMAKAIKSTEAKENVWMFRIFFGTGLALAAIGAIATLRCIVRNGF